MATKTKPRKPTKKSAAKAIPTAAGAGARTPARGEVSGSLPLAKIRPCPFNVRRHFDDADLAGLAESIGTVGLKERLLVRPIPKDGQTVAYEDGKWSGVDHFQLADGERRYRALHILNETREVDAVAVTIRDMTDDEVRAVMLVSREQSRDLSPSDLVAAYQSLAEGKTAEAVAKLVGKPVGHVRSVLRLAKLPAWALAAVDAGTLPRATAELVARVPGEESRKRAAACVVLGIDYPHGLERETFNDDESWKEAAENPTNHGEVLSYRATKDMLKQHFTRELKTAPFSRKSLTLIPEAGSCDACPNRAGNNEEAKADGVRGDICLDPDCYRRKVEAHDAAELAKGAKRGAVPVPEDFAWPAYSDRPPKGWCDVEAAARDTEIGTELVGTKHYGSPLLDVLKAADWKPGSPLLHAAIPHHKLRLVAKTSAVRAALVAGEILAKPERKPRATPSTDTGSKSPAAATDSPDSSKPLIAKVDDWEADERAAVIAANVLREYAEEQTSALAELPDAAEGGLIRDALAFIARAWLYDTVMHLRDLDFDTLSAVLKARFPDLKTEYIALSTNDKVIDPALAAMTAPQLIGLMLQVAAATELPYGPNRETGKDLLDWAELDWPQLREQARRELSGEPTADAKIEAAEKVQS